MVWQASQLTPSAASGSSAAAAFATGAWHRSQRSPGVARRMATYAADVDARACAEPFHSSDALR
jgi:hypothetical protein